MDPIDKFILKFDSKFGVPPEDGSNKQEFQYNDIRKWLKENAIIFLGEQMDLEEALAKRNEQIRLKNRKSSFLGKLMCKVFDDHEWTSDSSLGIKPRLSHLSTKLGFFKFARMYCKRCGKPSKFNKA